MTCTAAAFQAHEFLIEKLSLLLKMQRHNLGWIIKAGTTEQKFVPSCPNTTGSRN
jgi:hypothetical protein